MKSLLLSLRRFAFVTLTLGALLPVTVHAQSSASKAAVADAERLGEAFSIVAEKVSPSVVSIRVEVPQQAYQGIPEFFFGLPEQRGIAIGGGSGVILSKDGYILTNNHVIDGAVDIRVTLKDGRAYTAKLVGVDPATDLAVIKIPATNLPPAVFVSSENARVGQWVIAIGSPFGLDYTVTTGVLSAKGRGNIGINDIEDYLQTDASINPGNSGGPLVDLQGRVLGINSMIIGRGTGIGFAIASDLAMHASQQLISSGKVSRSWLGVSLSDLTPDMARQFGDRVKTGALINQVDPRGPAFRAGIKAGDIVYQVDQVQIKSSKDLQKTILALPVGKTVEVAIFRAGRKQSMPVLLVQRPSNLRQSSYNRR